MARTSIKKKLLVSLGSLVLFGTLLEVGLRVGGFKYTFVEPPIIVWTTNKDTEMDSGSSMFMTHPSQLWAPKPGAELPNNWAPGEVINEAGYRGPVLETEKKDGVLRVATLGDSSSFGHSVAYDETYTAVLEKALDAKGHDCDSLLGGVVGFALMQGIQRYQDLIRGHEPDVVVAAFGAINDHHPAIELPDREKIAYSKNRASWAFSAATWLREHSRSAQLVARTLDQLQDRMPEQRIQARIQRKRQQNQVKDTVGQVDWGGIRRISLEEFRVGLHELADRVEADGARLILVSMPRKTATEKTAPVLLEYTKTIAEVAEERGLPLCNARKIFRDAFASGTPEKDLMVDFVHPSPKGHRLIGLELARIIDKLVPADG